MLSAVTARLLLIRHGESTWNAEHRLQGQADPPLSPLGREQVGALVPFLEDVPLKQSLLADVDVRHRVGRTVAALHELVATLPQAIYAPSSVDFRLN